MRQVFKAKYIYELKVDEIAEDMGVSVNTVKTQLMQSKKKIKKLLIKD